MRNLFAGILILSTATLAQAQSIKVRRADGQRAIVQFSKSVVPQVNQVYSISAGQGAATANDDIEAGTTPPPSMGGGDRDYFIELANSVPFTMGGGGLSMTTSAKFGWNLGSFEIAPNVGFGKSSVGDVSTTSFNAGVMADINFIENRVGEAFVPAFTANLGFAKGGTLSFGGGLAAKLYVLRQSQSAIRLAIRFDGTKIPAIEGAPGSGGLGKSIQILEVGIQTYF